MFLRKHILIIIFVSFFVIVKSQNLQVYYNQSTFWSPQYDEYAEVYLAFTGATTKYIKNSNNKFNSELSVLITYSQRNEIKQFLKYNLKSPEINDTNLFYPNFIDIQRFKINSGRYKLNINIFDVNDSLNSISYTDSVVIKKVNDISFSDIEFVESFKKTTLNNIFFKNGYNIIPYVYNYYPENILSFNFYTELYIRNTKIKTGDGLLIKYYIEPRSNNRKYKLENYIKTERRKAEKINVIMGNFNIAKLPSGNYNFVIECINKKNEIICENKLFFQRKNKIVDDKFKNITSIKIENTFIDNQKDINILTNYIKCLFPIMESKQITHALKQLKLKNIEWMQKFFYSFWYEKNRYNPEEEWLKYKKNVDFVNRNFSTQIKKGYETDRGRIYLKYGKPNNIIKREHPVDSYPYEMWHYNSTPKKGNVKLVFYNSSMVKNDFVLVYTNLTDEASNSNWKSIIKKAGSSNFGNTIDDDFNGL